MTLRNELTNLRAAPAPTIVTDAVQPAQQQPAHRLSSTPLGKLWSHLPAPLVKQPAPWFALTGWGVAIVLLFRRKTIFSRAIAEIAEWPATLRFDFSLVCSHSGGALLLAAWALDHEPVVWNAASPYAIYFCFGALVAAILLSWYHDQSALLGVATAIGLTVWALERWPVTHCGTGRCSCCH